MIEREKKEERRSVNRPRVNEIFGLHSHASGYSIFVASAVVNYDEHLAPRAYTKPSERRAALVPSFITP